MSKVLYVQSSPRADRAYSTRVGQAFIDTYCTLHPEDEIEILDLWKTSLPPFDGDALWAKYARMRREETTPEQETKWLQIVEIIDHFRSFDKFVFTIPMWNFNVPYVLKHYFDILVQPGVSFGKNEKGEIRGFIRGKKAVCFCAAGSPYDGDAPLAPGDFLRPYLRWILGWVGIDDVQIELVAPTTLGDEAASAALTEAQSSAQAIARSF